MAKTVLITGASSGIGKALALTMAADGCKVIAVARSAEKLKALESLHENIRGFSCDLRCETEIKALFDGLASEISCIDQLVLNAGTCEYLDIHSEGWLALYRSVFSVNVEASLNMIEHSLPLLKCSEKPHIITIASMATLYPFGRAEIYGASKAALDYMMAAFRVDLQPLNIKVSTIYPGFIKTPLTDKNDFDMPFLMSAEAAALRINKAIKKEKKTYYFPKRLLCALKILSFLDFLGFRPKSLRN